LYVNFKANINTHTKLLCSLRLNYDFDSYIKDKKLISFFYLKNNNISIFTMKIVDFNYSEDWIIVDLNYYKDWITDWMKAFPSSIFFILLFYQF